MYGLHQTLVLEAMENEAPLDKRHVLQVGFHS